MKYPNLGRDYEYKRYGTVSLLASIDLLNGQIHDRHRSKELVGYLKGIVHLVSNGFQDKNNTG